LNAKSNGLYLSVEDKTTQELYCGFYRIVNEKNLMVCQGGVEEGIPKDNLRA